MDSKKMRFMYTKYSHGYNMFDIVLII